MDDGSWGSPTREFFDQLLSTIATINTLDSYGVGFTQIEKGKQWLLANIASLSDFDLTISGIGFVVLLPLQFAELEFCLDTDLGGGSLLQLWKRKIGQLPFDLILREHSHLAWNLEFLDTLDYDPIFVERQLVSDGSICCSISATA